MTLEENRVGSLTFTLRVDGYEGELIENVKESEPFDFVFGKGAMLQSFEDNLQGLKEGEAFKFMLSKDLAYGSYLPEMQIELERQFLVDQLADPELVEEELQVDNFLPMLDSDGNTLNGRIISMEENIVKLDFNHPLADLDLYFEGRVLGVRDAVESEIKDGRVLNITHWEEAGPDDVLGCQG